MTPIMTRTFFPVADGIFCLELFENRHAIVYDCGSTSKARVECHVSKLTDRNDIDVIDDVFISHFHEDHVNGLPMLLEKFDMRHVVMPLMSEKDMYLLWLGRQLRQPHPNVIPDLDSGDFIGGLILNPTGPWKDTARARKSVLSHRKTIARKGTWRPPKTPTAILSA